MPGPAAPRRYTATPQAPLLINIADILSPEFVDVLEPGDGYVGGVEFFGGNRQFTRVIPQAEIPSADNPLLDVPGLVDLINQKRAGKPITPKERPRGDNVVDLMEALRRSVGGAAAAPATPKKAAKKSKKTAPGQKEMLMPIAGKKPAKEAAGKKPSAKPQRKSA
jgi:hypothetical protein